MSRSTRTARRNRTSRTTSSGTAVRRRGSGAVAVLGAGALLAAGVAAVPGPGRAHASSHREAPLIATSPQLDNTDVYAFVSPDKTDTVTLVANFIPFEEPNGGPNFYPFAADARYNLNIDSDGDGKPDVTYRFTFQNQDKRGTSTFLYNNGPVTSLDDENLLFRQTYTVQEIRPGKAPRTIVQNAVAAPSNVGKASMPDYQGLRDAAVTDVQGGGKAFAGQTEDPFFLDLRVFDLLYGGNLTEVGQDTVAGYNVNTLVLQLPKNALALNGDAARNPVIGVWSTTERRGMDIVTDDGKNRDWGKFVQVSRLGNPLVNEVVVPAALKDRFNALRPDQDATVPQLVDRVQNPEVPQLIEKIYGLKAPAAPRADLVEIFLTGIANAANGPIKADLNSQLLNKDVDPKKVVPAEELRLNTAIPPTAKPNRLGVLGGDLGGFPNGRRLSDDVVDIELQALEGAAATGQIVPALAKGDMVDANNKGFGGSFPYVGLPEYWPVNRALPKG
ncbi:DUF4331 domain-containing protein [Yinghuangia seranimata]|uniref:DUF4331 domain-containing protein n=1 Tax=Yinghuangia seranimata TaxID=408067 RepID=UPI00248C7556|nr:DUF4331 domain-containing protein [Yinghuangia seranimata]MDI2127914.1 DUF4331 domain-containing protein [Yinghuangia seranimata]